jgi:hypothetical protein
MSYATNPNAMHGLHIRHINIDAEFEKETNIEIKLKLRVWKCEDGNFGMRAVWSRFGFSTAFCFSRVRPATATAPTHKQDETLDGGLYILKFCLNDLGDDDA